MTPAVICHGGAGALLKPEDYGTALAAVLEQAYRLLRQSGHAMEVVIEAVRLMEDDPVFNAGTGSYPTLDGRIEMDAAVMTQDGRFGGVCCISNVRNPVLVAAKVMTETDHLLLCGEGATEFARTMGFGEYEPLTEKGLNALDRLKREGSGYYPKLNRRLGVPGGDGAAAAPGAGTVGAVALDKYGKLAVATSSGGTVGRLRGRIGDTAVPGAGIYAGPTGAACCSGHGELILRLMLAKNVVDRTTTLPGSTALALAMAEARHHKLQCGVVGMDARGSIFFGHTTPAFAYGYKVADRLFLFTDGAVRRA